MRININELLFWIDFCNKLHVIRLLMGKSNIFFWYDEENEMGFFCPDPVGHPLNRSGWTIVASNIDDNIARLFMWYWARSERCDTDGRAYYNNWVKTTLN